MSKNNECRKKRWNKEKIGRKESDERKNRKEKLSWWWRKDRMKNFRKNEIKKKKTEWIKTNRVTKK